jgi:hypothetical protein
MADKAIGLKLDAELLQLASDVIQLTGESFKELVTKALEREIQARLKRDGGKLGTALEAMKAFRNGSGDGKSKAASVGTALAEPDA